MRCPARLVTLRVAVFVLMLMPVHIGLTQDRAGSDGSLPDVSLPEELDRVLRDYERFWTANDETGLASLFSTDGFIMRPGHPPVRGRANIEAAYRDSGGPLYLHAFHFERADSIAYIIGGYASAPDRPDSGKYVLTLRLESDGRWYITADMDNGNR